MGLAVSLAWKSLRHHRLISFATILGVAIGMCVVSTILIVDHNTARSNNKEELLNATIAVNGGSHNNAGKANASNRDVILLINKIEIVKSEDLARQKTLASNPVFPSQQLQKPVSAESLPAPRGEEDYQTMRLAIRMASMFAFFIGSVIVFYTMRFSVAMRIKEFALLLCLGEHQRNVSLSLIVESLILGSIGTLSGMLAAYPMSRTLLSMGISTTGRSPSSEFSIPVAEILIMMSISLFIVLVGVISPVRTLYRFQISQVLQPRFIEGDLQKNAFQQSGFSWLISPILLASYLAIRPFMENWLSVVYFFLLESVFIVVLSLVTIWLTRPFLRVGIRLIEQGFKHWFPLESLLTVRRIRLTSHKYVFSITGVILVFSLLNSLHAITRTLKDEIYHWSSEAVTPYYSYQRNSFEGLDQAGIERIEQSEKLHIFRLSAKTTGSFPVRLINSGDYNRYRKKLGQSPFKTGQVIFSKTLAARFGAFTGDFLHIETDTQHHNFEVVDVSDAVGTFAEDAQYIDIKSFALFTGGNPLFSDNLELTLGDFAVTRSARDHGPKLSAAHRHSLDPYYKFKKSGSKMRRWQLYEIDKDFLIFDFILLMTIVLAFIGIVNTLLIQVHSRGRELAVLTTLGIDQKQMFRLLLVEGMVIGVVGAVLSALLGTALGIVSVSFLDQFTLFQYEYVWSAKVTLLIAGFAVFTCCASAIYPAIVATKISTAESLHYE